MSVSHSVFAYGDRTNATRAELEGAPNDHTASCPHGIQERLVISLRDGGFGLNHREYQRIAAIIGKEAFDETCTTEFDDTALLHFISTCYQNQQLALLGKDLAEKKRILADCVMQWLRTNHGYRLDMPPPTALPRLLDTFDDMLSDDQLEGGGRRRFFMKKPRRTCKQKTQVAQKNKTMKNKPRRRGH